MKKQSFNTKSRSNYVLLLLFLMLSGNLLFDKYSIIIALFLIILYFFILLKYGIRKADFKYFMLYIGYFVLIFTLQLLNFNFLSFEGALSFLSKIIIGFLIFSVIGLNFKIYYFNIIYFLSYISLIGYFLIFFNIAIPGIRINEEVVSQVLFNYRTGSMGTSFRNPSMFWEPGVFAAYIILLFAINIDDLFKFIRYNKFKFLIIFLALITTYSTTAYLLFFIIIFYSVLTKTKIFELKILLVLLISIFSYFSFTTIDFLGAKINNQYQQALNRSSNEFSPDRFGALLFDFHYIKKSPIYGNGLHSETRYSDHKWLLLDEYNDLNRNGNGFSNFSASMGLLSFIFILIFLYKRINFKNYIDKIVFILIFFLVLQGEPLLNFPFFLTLIFMKLHYNDYNSSSINRIQ